MALNVFKLLSECISKEKKKKFLSWWTHDSPREQPLTAFRFLLFCCAFSFARRHLTVCWWNAFRLYYVVNVGSVKQICVCNIQSASAITDELSPLKKLGREVAGPATICDIIRFFVFGVNGSTLYTKGHNVRIEWKDSPLSEIGLIAVLMTCENCLPKQIYIYKYMYVMCILVFMDMGNSVGVQTTFDKRKPFTDNYLCVTKRFEQ